MFRRARPPSTALVAYTCFAVFGGFWGVWGVSIPAIRDQAGVSDAQLGTALLCVGAGALPSMLAAGRLVDRWGQGVAGALLAALGATGILVAGTARDLLTLSIGLTAMGVASGAADVAINAVAGSAQHRAGRPVISRAHAAFSAAVVLGSLGTGALHAGGAPLLLPFMALAAAAAAAGAFLPRRKVRAPGHTQPGTRAGWRVQVRLLPLPPLLILGVLGALAFAVENGHQSWSALYVRDVLHAGEVTAAAGPAVFAAVVAITRLSAAGLSMRHPVGVLVAGSALASAGTAAVGAATAVPFALLGLAVAAAGTAVLFPTLLGILTAEVPDHLRGTATSVVTTVAYLGFLAGPVYMGLWAGAVGLSGAMTALAGLAAVLLLLLPRALRHVRPRRSPVPVTRPMPTRRGEQQASFPSR